MLAELLQLLLLGIVGLSHQFTVVRLLLLQALKVAAVLEKDAVRIDLAFPCDRKWFLRWVESNLLFRVYTREERRRSLAFRLASLAQLVRTVAEHDSLREESLR